MTKANDDINLLQVFSTLRRSLLPILGATVLVGAGTYLVSRSQAPIYESRSSIISLFSNVGNQVVNNTLVTAPPLPQGALDEALRSGSVTKAIMQSVTAAQLGSKPTEQIQAGLQASLNTGNTSMIKVNSRLDTQQRGVYEIVAQAGTPRAARVLAGATVNALLGWDGARAQRGVANARRNIDAQLKALDIRIASVPAGSPDGLSLTAARGTLLQNLSQVAVLEQTSSGTLSPGADPSDPVTPVAPRPTRNAALAALLTLFAASGLTLLLSSLRGRVNSAADLMPLGLPLLGQVPLIGRRDLGGGMLRASRSGRLYESLGFLRINLSSVGGEQVKILAITSSRPGAGKSSLAATLSASFADEGKRVLLIDADLHRPTQHRLWNMASTQIVPLPGAQADLSAVQATLPFALQHPELACAVHDPAYPNVDLLPAGQASRQSQQLLNRPDLAGLLHRWASAYDLVIIDTPPILALAETLKLAISTDGVILVVESGETSLDELERVQQIAQQNGVKLLGTVINKVPRSEQSYYYGYNYAELPQK
ncbi:polysaccharide biosynthesis tyrosine autokinase [Deinococcus detaillensis]|uniref:Polysaccharide biosynthesis tyrosine autokinase n=1 Tax=Deinococcus detaillensis TaxID=2592048 RepID=A0A553UND6_9DEIO|nr:CpsD/CapB family tyrosine-protein kinase [Deinococcus detaillensis]TSA81471.1 polysaccharide biosynthesis tyrosine autokinase [Deinococcus detaillensis]